MPVTNVPNQFAVGAIVAIQDGMATAPITAHSRPIQAPTIALRGYALLFVCIVTLLLWASAFVGIRYAIRDYPPGALALARFTIATVLLVSYFLATGGARSFKRLTRIDLAYVVALGFTGIFVYHLALNAGERTVSAGTASLLINTTPIFTVLMAAGFLGDRLGRWGVAGIVTAFAGALLVSMGASGTGASFDVTALEGGALLVLVAAMSQAVYFIVQKHMLSRYGAVALTTMSSTVGCLLLSMFSGELWQTLQTAPLQATLVTVYLGVGPSAIAYLAWATIVTQIPVSKAVSFLYLVPPVAVGIAWLFLGEQPTMLTVTGGAVTIGGVALVHRRDRRAPT